MARGQFQPILVNFRRSSPDTMHRQFIKSRFRSQICICFVLPPPSGVRLSAVASKLSDINSKLIHQTCRIPASHTPFRELLICMVNRPGQMFIGRQPELATLISALDDALTGRGQMVMLAGEPGIGKTRLAQELASRAESLGAQVMWVWCYEHVGAPPYWRYVQPVRTYAEVLDIQTLSSQLG